MRRVLAVLAFVAAAAAVMVPWNMGKRAAGIDFFQFWAGAELLRRTDNLYAPEAQRSLYAPFVEQAFARDSSNQLLVAARTRNEFDFFSTPFLYSTFRLLPASYDRALFGYRVLSMAAFAGGLLLLARASRLSWIAAALVLLFALVLFEGTKSEVRVVNVNFVQVLMIGAGTWLACSRETWRSVAAGAVFALAAMFKPNVVLVLPLLFAHRLMTGERARLAREAAGAAAGIAIALVVSGPPIAWFQWLTRVREVSAVRPLSLGNVAPALPLVSAFGTAAGYVVAALLTGLVLVALRRAKSDQTPVIAGAAILVYLLSSTLVWLHYLVLALPAAIALIAKRPKLGAVALIFAGLDLFLYLGVSYQKTQALILWIGLLLLFAGSLLVLWRDEREVTHAG